MVLEKTLGPQKGAVLPWVWRLKEKKKKKKKSLLRLLLAILGSHPVVDNMTT